ncbi:MAG: hypothetical protein IH614_05050 [Desulfuromonadales bacterium]|nr:hypothetical protein [Desulfuromonadales bacterium]
MAQIGKISPALAEEARNVAMAELVKYLDLYGEATIAFNCQDGYAAARPLAVLAMAHLFRRVELGGAQAEEDLDRATTLLEVLADSYLAGEWGKTSWLSSLPVLNMGVAAQIGWPDFSPGLRNKISLVIKSEADYVAGLPPLSNVSAHQSADCSVSPLDVSCDSKSEENAAMANLLSFAASFYGHLNPRGNWLVKSKTFAYHSLTTPTDSPYGGYRTLTIFPDGSIGNHNIFPNIHYMLATSVLAAESVLFSSINDEVPTEYIRNSELVWDAARENINIQHFSYNNFKSDYSNDSPLWFPSAFAYATVVLGEDEALVASLLKEKAMTDYVAIPDSKKPTTVGYYDPEFFTNSNVLKRYLITWLLFANQAQGVNEVKIVPLIRQAEQETSAGG